MKTQSYHSPKVIKFIYPPVPPPRGGGGGGGMVPPCPPVGSSAWTRFALYPVASSALQETITAFIKTNAAIKNIFLIILDFKNWTKGMLSGI
jgi:hypothetical protein